MIMHWYIVYHLVSPPSCTPLYTYQPLQFFYYYITFSNKFLFLSLMISNTYLSSPPLLHSSLYPSKILSILLHVHNSKACNFLSSSFQALYRSMLPTKHFTILILSFIQISVYYLNNKYSKLPIFCVSDYPQELSIFFNDQK